MLRGSLVWAVCSSSSAHLIPKEVGGVLNMPARMVAYQVPRDYLRKTKAAAQSLFSWWTMLPLIFRWCIRC
jgi:hypothetical protein